MHKKNHKNSFKKLGTKILDLGFNYGNAKTRICKELSH
jgi:hypothetical protein